VVYKTCACHQKSHIFLKRALYSVIRNPIFYCNITNFHLNVFAIVYKTRASHKEPYILEKQR